MRFPWGATPWHSPTCLPLSTTHIPGLPAYLNSSATHFRFPFYRRSGTRFFIRMDGRMERRPRMYVCITFGSLLPAYAILPTYLPTAQAGRRRRQAFTSLHFTSLRFFACIIHVCMYVSSFSFSFIFNPSSMPQRHKTNQGPALLNDYYIYLT